MTDSAEIKKSADLLADAASALTRSIAGATYTIHDGQTPAYILGNLVAATRELGEVLEQLSQWHSAHSAHALDEAGICTTGAIQAIKTGAVLTEAAKTMDQANDQIMQALSLTNQTIWQIPKGIPA